MTTNDFSTFRYIGELRREAISRPSVTKLQAFIVFIVIFVVCMWTENNMSSSNIYAWEHADQNTYFTYDTTLDLIFNWMCFLFVAFSAVAASLMFGKLNPKQAKVSYLTEPVTGFEKFAAQFTLYVLGFWVLFMVSFIVVDLLRPVVFTVMNFGHTTHFSTMLTLYRSDPSEFVKQILVVWGGGTMIGSFYMLASVIWSRNSFVKCSAFLFLLMLWLGIFVALLSTLTDVRFDEFLEIIDRSITFGLGVLIMFSVAALNWFVAWLRLNETDLN